MLANGNEIQDLSNNIHSNYQSTISRGNEPLRRPIYERICTLAWRRPCFQGHLLPFCRRICIVDSSSLEATGQHAITVAVKIFRERSLLVQQIGKITRNLKKSISSESREYCWFKLQRQQSDYLCIVMQLMYWGSTCLPVNISNVSFHMWLMIYLIKRRLVFWFILPFVVG